MNDDERLALAHALRTPLTSALLSTGLLSRTRLARAQRELLAGLEEDLLRLRLLIEGGLDIRHAGSYAGPLERQPCLLGELIERTARPLVEQAHQRGVEVSSVVSSDALVLADTVKLGWAISAVLANAIRFARRKVRLVVQAGEEAQLVVSDDGPGIDPIRSERLFSRDGAGLGLFLVQEIVRAHGGQVELKATSAAGTTFAVRLPILLEESHAETR